MPGPLIFTRITSSWLEAADGSAGRVADGALVVELGVEVAVEDEKEEEEEEEEDTVGAGAERVNTEEIPAAVAVGTTVGAAVGAGAGESSRLRP